MWEQKSREINLIFYEVNNAKRYFLLKKPKKSILELRFNNN